MKMNIGRTIVASKYIVSTVDAWGAIETMVFECDAQGNVTNFLELDARRYTTYEEAKAGHKHMVETWERKV